MSNYIPQESVNVIINPCPNISKSLLTHLWLVGSAWAIPSWSTQSSRSSIPYSFTIHARRAGYACTDIMLWRQVIEGPLWARVLIGLLCFQRAIIARRANIWAVIWCICQAVMSYRAALAGVLRGEILIETSGTSLREVRALDTEVARRAYVSYHGVDSAFRTLGVIEIQRVGLVVTRDTIVARPALGCWVGEIGTWRLQRKSNLP